MSQTEINWSGDQEAAVVAALALAASPVTNDLNIVLDDEGNTVEERVYGWDPTHGRRLVDTVDRERLEAHPRQFTGSIAVHTPKALVAYATRHVDWDFSTCWVNAENGAVTVVINDHERDDRGSGEANAAKGPAKPGWADHRATLQFVRSPEWKAWAEIDGKWLTQADLAAFLEDHLLNVVEPDGTTLMDITRTFHATEGATFKSTHNDGTGQQSIVYEQEINGSSRDGNAAIPTDLTLRLRPWLGVDPVEVDAKFRFRVNGGALVLGVRLIRADQLSRDAVEEAATEVGEQLGLSVIEGDAPKPRR